MGSDSSVPVKILRDTAAFNSYIVSSVLPFSHQSDTGDYVLMRGISLTVLPVLLHKLVLNCGLVQGEVAMGVRHAFPIDGVDIIPGNDLAGSRVWAKSSSSPIVTSSPLVKGELYESAQGFPEVLTACAVTRAMCHAERGLDQIEKGDKGTFPMSFPDPFLSVSRSDLMAELRADSSLTSLYDWVVTVADGRSAANGYFVQDGLLVRKWMPHGDKFVGDSVLQVVVPSKFCTEVLKAAHDHCVHLGVRKTYAYILRYFFWPCVKRDVSSYIRTCSTCQLTGKPNQGIKPAPLYPIPAIAQPFEHLIVDCVGPLPCSKSGSKYLLTVMCQSTRYLAAYPLRSITAKSWFSAYQKYFRVIRAQMFLLGCLLKC